MCCFLFFCSLPPRFFSQVEEEEEEERSSRVREASRYLFLPKRDREGQKSFWSFFLPVASLCVGCEERARGEERCALERDREGENFFFLGIQRKHGTKTDLVFFPRAALETNRNQSIPTAPLSSGPRPGPRTRRDICTGSDWITDSGGTRETIREGD